MLPIARLTSAGYDLACHLFPRPFFAKPPRKISRKKAGRLRRLARLELDRLEDRTLLSAAISGNVFNDLNGSGARIGGDPGVAGQTVFLDLNHDGKLDPTNTTIAAQSTTLSLSPVLGGFGNFYASTIDAQNVPTAVQDVAVTMDVTNSSSEAIQVSLLSPTGSEFPQFPILFNLQPGTSSNPTSFNGTFNADSTISLNGAPSPLPNGPYAPQMSFNNPQLYILGQNPNGEWELNFLLSNPSDLSKLTLNSWSLKFTSPDPSTTTDAAGNYAFTNLNAGDYQVGVALTPNETATAPVAGSATVSLSDGQSVTGFDFGVKPAADLTATAFYLTAPATAWGQSVTINYTLTNQGLGDAPAFDVGLYLSNNGVISTSGPLLDTLHIDGLAAGASTSGSVTVQLPSTPPAGFDSLAGAYVGSVIDPTNSIPESSANQSNQGAGIDLAQLGTASNIAVTSGSSVEQSPSVAVDPNNPQHLVTAYMDYSLLSDGYAGIGISSSTDGGATWTKETPIPLPAGFNQGAAAPTVVFDAQGNVYVSFMAATFQGNLPDQTAPGSNQRLDGFESNNGIFVAESKDGGTTWGTPQAVVENVYNGSASVPFEAYPDMAIDTFKTLPKGQANPNYGNIYVTWSQFYPPGQFPGDPSSTSGSDVMFAISNTSAFNSSNTSNGGSVTFTTQMQTIPGSGAGTGVVSAIKDPVYGFQFNNNGQRNDGGSPGTGMITYSNVVVGAGGDVYVATNTAGYYTVYASKDGGQSFSVPNVLSFLGSPFNYTNQLVLSDPTLDNFRTLPTREIVADPTRPGVLYAVADNGLAEAKSSLSGTVSTSGILFAVSDDYGQSWTTNFTVGSEGSVAAQLTPGQLISWFPVLNDENGGQFPPFGSTPADQVIASQGMPEIAINAQGDISVIWYDTRSDPSGTDVEVWGTVSTDGGQHFSANFPISSESFNPNNGSFTDGAGNTTYYLGDQIGLAATGNTAYALWTDTRGGGQNIFATSFALNHVPAAPADRFSPNNTRQTATNLGKVTVQQVVPQLALSPGSADEWFSLQAGATGELKASITAASGGGNLQFQLTDANGTVLSPVISNILGPTGAVIGQELVYSSVAGQTYLLHVSGQSTSGIEYTLVVSSLTADLGPQVQGTVANSLTPGGVAVYGLQMTATGTLTVTLNANSNVTAGNLNLQILGTDGALLASLPTDGISAGWSAQVTLAVSQAQVVLIVVSGNTSTAQGDYKLLFTNLDQFQSTGATLGVTVQGPDSLAAGGENDYFLQSNATSTITATLTADSDVNGMLDLTAYVFDSDPTVLNYVPAGPTVDISAGQSAHVSVGMTKGETNPPVIDIVGQDSTAQGDYTIQISEPLPSTGPATLFFPTGSTPSAVAAAYLNGNGNGTDDLLATNTTTSDTLSVLIGNGNGTFQAPQQVDVGPGLSTNDSVVERQLAVADLTGNGIPDVIVPNSRSADVSVLLGNGNGTFQPQRRFDAVTNDEAVVTGDFNGDGHADLAVVENFAQTGGSQLAILLGRGDGTFLPPQPPVPNDPTVKVTLYQTAFTSGVSAMVAGDFTGNGILDLIVFSDNSSLAQIFYGNGDGTFRNGGTFFAGDDIFSAEAVDLNGDGKLDLVTTGVNSGNVFVLLGNGDGTFQTPQPFLVQAPRSGDNVSVKGLAVVDFGSAAAPGTPDKHLDIIVTAEARSGQGGATVYMLPGLVDSQGNYAGFGAPVVLAHVGVAGNIAVGDFTGNGAVDLAVADTGGITVIYGTPPTIATNNTLATARDLGTVTHLETLPESIVSAQEDAYYTLTVPTEAAPGSGDEVLDFDMQVQSPGGGGLQMQVQVLDANGKVQVLGTGTRFRVTAAQGAVLTVHIFGVTGTDGTPGSGSYILDVDVLPQVVSVQAESPLPGGPATSIVITLQGDHLDPATAENPANYSVIWLGPDGLLGTADDQIIPIAATAGNQPIVYDPGADVQVASGLTPNYPAASRQTITLLFANPLPAGSYEIILSPAIQSAALNSSEGALLAGNTSLAGHPLVTNDNGTSDRVIETDLVSKGGTPNPDAIDSGTAFLTQLGNDLGALLDSLLAQEGDDPSITAAINDQILARFKPGYTPGTGPQTYAIFWLDPVAIGLQTPQGQQVSYNLQSNAVSNTASQTYISVGGNVEVIVVAGISGTFNLSVANVPETARGGAVVITPNGTQEVAFTDGLRSNTPSFEVTVANAPPVPNPLPGPTPPGPMGPGNPPPVPPAPGPGNLPPGTPTPPGQIVTPTAPTGETVTASAANVSSSSNSFSDTLAQLVSAGLISSLVNNATGEAQATSATSFVSTGPAGNGATAGPGSTAAAGGSSVDAISKFVLDVENAVDEVFLRWRDGADAVVSASRPYVTDAVDVVEKAVSPVGNLLEAVGGKALMRTGLPWRDMLKILSQYSGAVTEEFSKDLPIPRVKGIQSAPPAVQPPAPEEEQESLWEQDFSESPLGEQMMWEGKEAGLALLVVSGAYHAWLRDQADDETTDRKKPEMFPVE